MASKEGSWVVGIVAFIRRFRAIIYPERWLVLGAFATLIGEVLLRLAEPWPLKIIVDDVLLASEGAGGAGFIRPLLLLCLAAVVFTAGRAMFAYLTTVGFALVGNRFLTKVRDELFAHLQTLSIRYHSKRRLGDVVLRVVADVGLLRDVAVTALLPLVGNIAITVSLVAVMFWLNPRLTLIVATILPAFYLLSAKKTKAIRQVARKQRHREAELASQASASMNAIAMVQALDLSATFQESFSRQGGASLQEGVRGRRLAAGYERGVDLIVAVGYALAMGFGGYDVVRGRSTLGEWLVYLTYLKSAFKPLRNAAKFTGRIAKASAASERVLEIFDEQPEIVDGAEDAPAFVGRVRFESVGFAYVDASQVYRSLDIDIAPGERVALVGASGSGKSTLAALLLRLVDPGRGRVLIDGHDIRRFRLGSLRRQFSVILQEPFLFATTVRANIAYGNPDASLDEIHAAARLANAEEFIRALPDGYDTVLGEGGVSLSVGQRQRLAIARAAVRSAPILIFDEPTSALDRANVVEVQEALVRLSEGKTTIWISHDPTLAGRVDRVLRVTGESVLVQPKKSDVPEEVADDVLLKEIHAH